MAKVAKSVDEWHRKLAAVENGAWNAGRFGESAGAVKARLDGIVGMPEGLNREQALAAVRHGLLADRDALLSVLHLVAQVRLPDLDSERARKVLQEEPDYLAGQLAGLAVHLSGVLAGLAAAVEATPWARPEKPGRRS